MLDEQYSSNHVPRHKATCLIDACAGLILRAPQGVEFDVIGAIGDADTTAALDSDRPREPLSIRMPTYWTVKQMAKQLGVSESYVYRHARDWPFTVRLNGARGRGSDLRFVASEAAEWLNRKRAKR